MHIVVIWPSVSGAWAVHVCLILYLSFGCDLILVDADFNNHSLQMHRARLASTVVQSMADLSEECQLWFEVGKRHPLQVHLDWATRVPTLSHVEICQNPLLLQVVLCFHSAMGPACAFFLMRTVRRGSGRRLPAVIGTAFVRRHAPQFIGQ